MGRIIVFTVLKDGNITDLKYQVKSPESLPIPLPGDEVEISKEVATKAGFSKSVFKVVSRCFIYTGVPDGVSGVISLVISQES